MNSTAQTAGSTIDSHRTLAFIQLPISAIVATMYYILAAELGVATPVWKIVLVVQVVASLTLGLHYSLNRTSRRLWIEGVVSPLIFIPFLMMGFMWIFSLFFVPMPDILRALVFVFCCLWIVTHAFGVFSDFRRAVTKPSVVDLIYRDNGTELILSGVANAYVDSLTKRTPFKKNFMQIIMWFSPFAAVFGLNASNFSNGGPQALCLVLSSLGFPMTAWIIGNVYVRSAFFHVYLPLSLNAGPERKC